MVAAHRIDESDTGSGVKSIHGRHGLDGARDESEREGTRRDGGLGLVIDSPAAPANKPHRLMDPEDRRLGVRYYLYS